MFITFVFPILIATLEVFQFINSYACTKQLVFLQMLKSIMQDLGVSRLLSGFVEKTKAQKQTNVWITRCKDLIYWAKVKRMEMYFCKCKYESCLRVFILLYMHMCLHVCLCLCQYACVLSYNHIFHND